MKTKMRQIKFRAWINRKMENTPRIPFPNDETRIPVNDMFSPITLLYGEPIKWMQFTGLHDKNGKNVYEGDLVKFIDAGGHERTQEADMGWAYDGLRRKDLEVIGNIYETVQ